MEFEEHHKSRNGQLVSKNCTVCGSAKTYNATLIDVGDETYLARVCSSADCRQKIYDQGMTTAIVQGGRSRKATNGGNGISHNPAKK